MTKEHAVKQKVKKHLGFYAVLMLCMAMISFACWFAYEQTKQQLKSNLNSAVRDIKVMEVQTDIPRATQPPVETETIPETRPETKPETRMTRPISAVPMETVIQEAAVIDAPETAPVTEQTQTETVLQTAAEPPCYPLNGEILEEFSGGELVKSKTTGIWQTHNGIDIAGNLGDTVCAVSSGIVQNIENDALWGVTVTIDHQNGYFTRYCSLNSGLSVSIGDTVEKSTVIGALGDTADIESSLPTHLHFEVLQGEKYLNPVDYLGAPAAETVPETE